MALNFLLKRSATASKRPVAASMAFGEIDINYNSSTGGLFYKDSAGSVVKVGPAEVGSTAPNSSPAGSSGNSAGEFWYDTSNTVLKIWNGTSWVNTVSTSGFLPLAGGTMTGNITFNGAQTFPVSGIQSASTTQKGVVQLNDTVSSTSITEALTANQGKNLQDQINALAVSSNITLAGTIDASTGNLASVTSEGTAAGFTVGNPLPAAASGNDNYFVIVTVAGTMTPPGGTAQECHQGDWWLSSGTAWEFLDVGFNATAATTSAPGVVQLATDAEVQAGLNTDHAVTPSGLQSKLSDSTSTTSSTTIASSTAVKDAYDAGIQGQTDAAAAQATADAAVPDASFTALGDILGGTGAATYSALALGTDGDVLTADSTCANGLKWAASSGGIPASAFTVKGGLLAGTGASAYTEVPAGTDGQILTYVNSKGTCNIFWCDPIGPATPLTYGTVYGYNDTLSSTCNVSVGQGTLGAVSLGLNNTALGFQALGYVSDGCDNVAIGFCAGTDITTGSQNVVIGSGVQPELLLGSCQLAIGYAAGQTWLTGDSTKAIKPGAGIIDCAGSCGTAGQVLMSNGANAICWGAAGGASPATPTVAGVVLGDTDASNTALGCSALASITTGISNTLIGRLAGTAIADGCDNTFIGDSAGCFTVGGLGHTIIGACAGKAFNTGFYNVFIGAGAGCSVAGSRNVFVGTCAGCGQTSGSRNVAIGDGIQVPVLTASDQLAIGSSSASACWLTGCSTGAIRPGAGIMDCAGSTGTAGQVLMSNGSNKICWGAAPAATPTVAGTVFGCTNASFNAYLGCQAGQTSTGGSNVAIGGCSLFTNTTGTGNTAVGAFALLNNTGNYNTAVGRSAMLANTTGCGNVQVGGFNSTGSNAPVFAISTENNRVVMGSNAVTNAYVQVAWTVVSDARDKIVDGTVPHGLDFVNQLEPKAFHFKETRESTDPHGPLRYGFLAQDILALEGGEGVIVDNEDPDKLRYNGEALVPVLVNAIKELSAKNDELEARLRALEIPG